MRFSMRRAATVASRLIAFAVTMVPLAALFLPWLALDGSEKTYTGVTCIALLVSPIREYLYEVDPVQATILTLGPALIVILSIVISNRYFKRRAVLWGPPALLVFALVTIYLTANLVSGVYKGPYIVAVAAILLIFHQVAIRLRVATRRNRKISWASGPLAVATGIDDGRRRRR